LLGRKLILIGHSAIFAVLPSDAYAIPSPELIIGSASAVTQIFAVFAAVFSGLFAAIAGRLGLKPPSFSGSSRSIWGLCLGLVALLVASVFANMWLYADHKADELRRLQSTLLRPASFAGNKIQDENLIETSFSIQGQRETAITTSQAFDLMNNNGQEFVSFIDIRETAERKMGALPNSSHIRCPDISETADQFFGKTVVLYCHNGNRSSETCSKLAAMGIDCRFIAGGIEKWIVEGRPFTDENVRGLSDLRSIPEYENKDILISTDGFSKLLADEDLQVLDTRYPGEFEKGHLPGAINIPLRALPTAELNRSIAILENRPTVAACYDRRSCFMAQVLGWELANRGIDFRGRYTTPWAYYPKPLVKPHIQAWQAAQSIGYWQQTVSYLSLMLRFAADHSHILFATFCLALVSRILILPIAIKSERDQIKSRELAPELKALKEDLSSDPIRKARAIQRIYNENGLTPVRNMSALLFLPVMMLGLSAVQNTVTSSDKGIMWFADMSLADPSFILPLLFSILSGSYLHWAVATNRKPRLICWFIVPPLLFPLTYKLPAIGVFYLCCSIALLFFQRMYVVGIVGRVGRETWRWMLGKYVAFKYMGLIPLLYPQLLAGTGNKAYRLSVMRKAGIPVPNGIVMSNHAILRFGHTNRRHKMVHIINNYLAGSLSAVRSSAAEEDGNDHSFAGVFETILDVKPEDLEVAIETVIRSFNSERSNQYLDQKIDNISGNIVIQEMQEPLYSGVMFTQDPQAAGLTLVEFVKGTADNFVSGLETPTTLRFGRFTGQNDTPSEDKIPFRELLEHGIKIEKIFGCPQDIEWTFDGLQIQIVQSRDITTTSKGSSLDLARSREWGNVLKRVATTSPCEILLEQDEMSEVLPRPTPMSFSIMSAVWGAGGSVDLAARSLGLKYDVPEGGSGHLVRLFGKLYSDPKLKENASFAIKSKDFKRLNRAVLSIEEEFKQEIQPAVQKVYDFYLAMNFELLPRDQLLGCIESLFHQFVYDFYVFSEKTNILAAFTNSRALEYCRVNELDSELLMSSIPFQSPSGIIRRSMKLKRADQQDFLIKQMGHRAMFDYEISEPRYSEAIDMLSSLSKTLKYDGADADGDHHIFEIDAALRMQNLKENAKHETLKIYSLLRKALLVISKQVNSEGHVFYLSINEVLKLTTDNEIHYMKLASNRMSVENGVAQFAPRNSVLTLQDCERLSGVIKNSLGVSSKGISGTLVAGPNNFSGRCYVVDEQQSRSGSSLVGFCKGDILICQMVHPAWLENVLMSSAVLAEVGGWLSHIAIVAREKNKTFFVKCNGIHELRTGDFLEKRDGGEIKLTKIRQNKVSSATG